MGGDLIRFDARGGEVASEDVRDDLPSRFDQSIAGDGPGHAKLTATGDVEPKTWALERNGLAESANSIACHPPGRAGTTREEPATHQPAIRGRSADDQQRRG